MTVPFLPGLVPQIKHEKAAYEKAAKEGPRYKKGDSFDLGMRVLLVHGDEVVADTQAHGFSAACDTFAAWCERTFPKAAVAAA